MATPDVLTPAIPAAMEEDSLLSAAERSARTVRKSKTWLPTKVASEVEKVCDRLRTVGVEPDVFRLLPTTVEEEAAAMCLPNYRIKMHGRNMNGTKPKPPTPPPPPPPLPPPRTLGEKLERMLIAPDLPEPQYLAGAARRRPMGMHPLQRESGNMSGNGMQTQGWFTLDTSSGQGHLPQLTAFPSSPGAHSSTLAGSNSGWQGMQCMSPNAAAGHLPSPGRQIGSPLHGNGPRKQPYHGTLPQDTSGYSSTSLGHIPQGTGAMLRPGNGSPLRAGSPFTVPVSAGMHRHAHGMLPPALPVIHSMQHAHSGMQYKPMGQLEHLQQLSHRSRGDTSGASHLGIPVTNALLSFGPEAINWWAGQPPPVRPDLLDAHQRIDGAILHVKQVVLPSRELTPRRRALAVTGVGNDPRVAVFVEARVAAEIAEAKARKAAAQKAARLARQAARAKAIEQKAVSCASSPYPGASSTAIVLPGMPPVIQKQSFLDTSSHAPSRLEALSSLKSDTAALPDVALRDVALPDAHAVLPSLSVDVAALPDAHVHTPVALRSASVSTPSGPVNTAAVELIALGLSPEESMVASPQGSMAVEAQTGREPPAPHGIFGDTGSVTVDLQSSQNLRKMMRFELDDIPTTRVGSPRGTPRSARGGADVSSSTSVSPRPQPRGLPMLSLESVKAPVAVKTYEMSLPI